MPHHQKAVSGAETTDLWGSGPDAWQGEPRAPLPGGHKQQKVPYEKGTIARILPEKKFGKHYRQLVLGPRNQTHRGSWEPRPTSCCLSESHSVSVGDPDQTTKLEGRPSVQGESWQSCYGGKSEE